MNTQTERSKAGSPAQRWSLTRFARDRDGVAAIEFAMLALPFMLLVFVIIESCISFAAQQVLSNAMDDVSRHVRTGRDVVTGQKATAALTAEKLETALCGRMSAFGGNDCKDKLEVDLRAYTTYKLAAADGYKVSGGKIFIDRAGALLQLQVTPGQSETINTIRVFYKWPVITDIMRKYMVNFGDNKTLLFATTTWRNEPYDD